MRGRTVAVLRGLPRRNRSVGPAVVRAVRRAGESLGALVPPLSTGADPRGAGAVPVRRTAAPSRAPAEVRRMASGRRRARRGDGGRLRPPGRRGHVGAALPPQEGVARVRSGTRARACRRSEARPFRGAAPPSRLRGRPAGEARRRGAAERDARLVRGGRPAFGAGPPRRRRPDDGRDGRGVRRRARSRGRIGGLAPDGGASRVRRVRRGSPPILGSGLASGSVVARGSFPGSRSQPRAKRPT
jgi:hypothetical protein